ncbi:hypothetical protein [Rhizobium daejeonense]|nr:hypothetical protein [Rhizobium daejeonense]
MRIDPDQTVENHPEAACLSQPGTFSTPPDFALIAALPLSISL